MVKSAEEAARVSQDGAADTSFIYGAGGSAKLMESVIRPDRFNLLFLRHRSGPVSLWYEIADPRLLRKTTDERTARGIGVEDVVVDSLDDVAVRLRAQQAIKNTMGKRILAIGGASGWGQGGKHAPDLAACQFRFDIHSVSYEELAPACSRPRRTRRPYAVRRRLRSLSETRRAAAGNRSRVCRPRLSLD